MCTVNILWHSKGQNIQKTTERTFTVKCFERKMKISDEDFSIMVLSNTTVVNILWQRDKIFYKLLSMLHTKSRFFSKNLGIWITFRGSCLKMFLTTGLFRRSTGSAASAELHVSLEPLLKISRLSS